MNHTFLDVVFQPWVDSLPFGIEIFLCLSFHVPETSPKNHGLFLAFISSFCSYNTFETAGRYFTFSHKQPERTSLRNITIITVNLHLSGKVNPAQVILPDDDRHFCQNMSSKLKNVLSL